MSFDLNFTDDNWHKFSLYALDINRLNLQMRFEVFDLVGQLLDTRELKGFGDGAYLSWNLRGHVSIRVSPINGTSTAIINGLFFD